jgi:nucleoside permease NupC
MGRLTGVLGILVILLFAYLFSTNRRAIRIKTIAIGLALQFIWVWLLLGNEFPPLHRLKEALLVLVNVEGPVFFEML